MELKERMLIQRAIQVAEELEIRLEGLGLYLAGTPATIAEELRKLLNEVL